MADYAAALQVLCVHRDPQGQLPAEVCVQPCPAAHCQDEDQLHAEGKLPNRQPPVSVESLYQYPELQLAVQQYRAGMGAQAWS